MRLIDADSLLKSLEETKKEILGHDRIDTTMTYVYISKTNVKNAYRKFA